MMQILKSSKQRTNKKKIFGFDIETSDKNRKFDCASLYFDDDNILVFLDKRQLIDFIKTIESSIIVATNLMFDFYGVYQDEPEEMKIKPLMRGSSLISAKTWIKNNDYSTNSKKGKLIHFLDTMNYNQMSVEKMGDMLKIPKLKKPKFLGTTPKNKKQLRELIVYNIQDSKISKNYLEFFYDSAKQLGASTKMTVASTSMSLFRNKYLKQEIMQPSSELLKDMFKSYYGGRTEVFKRGRISKCNYYDINSLYPSVMHDFEFPDPNSMKISRKNTIDKIREYEGCSHVKVFCPTDIKIPILPYRDESKRLLFPTGTFEGWYTHVEIRKAISLGYVIQKVYHTYYFTKNIRPFKEFVSDLYNLRLKFKSEGSPNEDTVKLIMNSFYGKFGQKFTDKDEFRPFDLTLEELDKIDDFDRVGNYIRIKHKETKPAYFCVPIWASYVTAYGRLRLYEYLEQYDPIYCDTDSIITQKEIPTSKELGKMKLEMKIKEGIIVRPKFYMIKEDGKNEPIIKIKGLGCHLSEKRFIQLEDDNKIVYQKFMRLRESIRRQFKTNEIVETHKELDLEDVKRSWIDKFNMNELQDSLPVTINK